MGSCVFTLAISRLELSFTINCLIFWLFSDVLNLYSHFWSCSFLFKISVWSFQGTNSQHFVLSSEIAFAFNRFAILCCVYIARQEIILFLSKWRWWDSNSWPPACKAGALPTELHPHSCSQHCMLMGLSGLEPPTSRLSGVRSNRLSYKPIFNLATTCFPIPSPV